MDISCDCRVTLLMLNWIVQGKYYSVMMNLHSSKQLKENEIFSRLSMKPTIIRGNGKIMDFDLRWADCFNS